MSQEVVVSQPRQSPSLFPTESEWNMIREQASLAVKTGFLPKAVDTPEKAITIALKGRELGIPPMQAFSHIHIIQGKPTISAELMLSLIYRNVPGTVINYIETSSKACVIEAKRPGGKPTRFAFTIEEAKQAGLLSKDSWKSYPGAMLRARCVSIVARALFPDAIMGCSYTAEELGGDVEMDETGAVINVQAEVLPSVRPEQPGEGDGDTSGGGKQRFRVGQHRGRSPQEIGPQACARWVEMLDGRVKKTGRALEGEWLEDYEMAVEYVTAFENSPIHLDAEVVS